MTENQLDPKERTLVAIALLRTCMRQGPDAFPAIALIADKIGVGDEFAKIAEDWLVAVSKLPADMPWAEVRKILDYNEGNLN